MITVTELKKKTEQGLLNTIEQEMNSAADRGCFFVVVPGMTTNIKSTLQKDGFFVEALPNKEHRISWSCD